MTQDRRDDAILVSTTPLTRIFLSSKRLQYSLQSVTLDLHSFKGDLNFKPLDFEVDEGKLRFYQAFLGLKSLEHLCIKSINLSNEWLIYLALLLPLLSEKFKVLHFEDMNKVDYQYI